jgi:RNA polymerase sigma factor (sigma-70 family)
VVGNPRPGRGHYEDVIRRAGSVGEASPKAADADLVAAARAGDRGAFALLVLRHRAMVAALCRQVLDDPLLVEDATQETILQAMLGLDRLRDPERFGAWLAGIGLNVSRRWRRQRRRSRLVLEGPVRETEYGAAPAFGTQPPAPDEVAEAAEVADRVRRAVASLPPGQRRAVVLFYLSGLTHREVAASLGIEVGAVKARLHRSRAALERRLRDLRGEEAMVEKRSDVVPVRLTDVRRGPAEEDRAGRYVALLEEVDGDRSLQIWIGANEGTALAMNLENVECPRPLTYQFMASALSSTGAGLREVRIERLVDQTFYAVAVIDGPGGRREVDARPSDAMNLALLVDAPIRVATAVFRALDERGPSPDCPTGEELLRALPEGAHDIAASQPVS